MIRYRPPTWRIASVNCRLSKQNDPSGEHILMLRKRDAVALNILALNILDGIAIIISAIIVKINPHQSTSLNPGINLLT